MREALMDALRGFAENGSGSLRSRAATLFGALGYRSDRTTDVGSVADFLEWLRESLKEDGKDLTERQRRLFDGWRSAEIVFQLTGEEIDGDRTLFPKFEEKRDKSFLFVAAELNGGGAYTRTELAGMTRAVNSGFRMPVVLLLRHGGALTLSVVHRRAHKRDKGRDVLEKVTLIKDIHSEHPHRAHVDILGELALSSLREKGVRDFDGLHRAWEDALDTETLNRRFYRDLFEWFERARRECRFPDDGAGAGSPERHVIRLITRLLFIWFLKEKGLVPERLFEERFARRTLRDHAPARTDYYRAVLQNLFFATLNTAIRKRAFSGGDRKTHRDFSRYRYSDLLIDPDGFAKELRQVPFVNGGLFDCLDHFEGKREGGRRVDVFTDNPAQRRELDVPARLFFDEDKGLFPILRRYKFTVEENTPIDQEVALDPELLGLVFENLLAAYNPEMRDTARKDTGSYYTPRWVVDDMAGEALAEALAAKSRPTVEDEESWRARLRYLLEHSAAMNDADTLFEKAERRAVVDAIANLRVLDPAAGSGAFPMGVLQKLTLALRRLDPDNRLWEELQRERARAQAGAAFDIGNRERREDALRQISATFEKYRASDYGRKLYLIQNAIYGVDIQPVACQIAKLRFFISLAIEQEPTGDARENYGIRPLPNLETRFVATDTLLGLGDEGQQALGSDRVRALENALRQVRERYFNATDRNTKRLLRKRDAALRDALARALEDLGFKHDSAERIARWDPYDQTASVDWFEPEYMFGVSGGFDVVIGNPPYVQLEKNAGELAKRYEGARFSTFAPRGDIYQLFYERGCRLLRPGAGVLAYITSNSWLKAEYGKRLRRFFAESHTPLRLWDDRDSKVFEASVDASILLVREGKDAADAADLEDNGAVRLPAIKMKRTDSSPPRLPPQSASGWDEAHPDGEAPWSILSAVEWGAFEKIQARGVPLKGWDVRINMGIRTGYNEAFIINAAARNALVDEDPRSAEIIQPVLRGQDIERWRAHWKGLWLIVAKFGSHKTLPDDYPAVYQHLTRHEVKLRARGQCRYTRSGSGRNPDYEGQHHWLELDNNPKDSYINLFAKEKLFWRDITLEGRFSYSEKVMYCNNKGFVLTGSSLKYLCAVLNSALGAWMARNLARSLGKASIQWEKFVVEQIPVPRISGEEQRPLVRLVDEIIAAKAADPKADTAAPEAEIDRLVYRLYGLDRAEIEAVRKSVS